MACNAPIDISPTNATQKCTKRCTYTFNYPVSSCTATVDSDHISLTYKASKPVNFNSVYYDIVKIHIYSKPLHSYGGQPSDGEIVIIHKSATNAILMICIPLVKSELSIKSSDNLTYLMNTLTNNANGAELKNFMTLNDFVGKRKFYTYSGSNFLGLSCSQNVDYIVYRPNDYSVNISSKAYEELSALIKEHVYKTVTEFKSPLVKPMLYINEKGPNISSNDQIYIDCQPVNASEETVNVTNEKYTPLTKHMSFNFMNSLKKDQSLQIMLCFIIFIIIMYISYYSIEIVNAVFKPFFKNKTD